MEFEIIEAPADTDHQRPEPTPKNGNIGDTADRAIVIPEQEDG